MTLSEARKRAQYIANVTGETALVYHDLLRSTYPDEYGAALTLPTLAAEDTGERVSPER